MGKSWRAHVVLVPGPAPGHTVPFLDLAIRIIAGTSQVKVTILAVAHCVPQFWRDGLYSRWAPRLRAAHPDIEVVPVEDGIYDGTLEGFHTWISEAAEARLIAAFGSALASLDESPPPCCIISDMLVGWTAELAAKLNIPRYLMHIQPANNLAVILHVPALVAEGRLPFTEDNQTEPVKVPGVGFPVHPADLPTDLHDPGALRWGSYEFYLRMARRAREAPVVLVNTFRELEEDVLAALDSRVIPIGPLLLPPDYLPADTTVDENEEIRTLMQWLDLQPAGSVLYVAFGTLVNTPREEMEEIAHGLAASGQPFLWSAGSLMKGVNNASQPGPTLSQLLPPGYIDVDEENDTLSYISWRERKITQGLEERTRERGKIATFVVPQLRVLRHPACGAFLCHCGWNTVLESLASGVPLIVWPRKYEQRMTARYLVDIAKVAAELVSARAGIMGRGEIERVVRMVMQQKEGEAFRSRALELKEVIAARYAHSNPNLNAVLAELIN